MKITTNQQIIDRSIKVVESYAAKEGSNGTTYILFEVDKDANTVTLTAEGDISATQYTILDGVTIEESGRLIVPAARLKTAVSNVPAGEEVTLEADNLNLTISSGRRKLSLALLDIHSMILPRVNEAGDNVAVFDTREFVNGFKGGSAISENSNSSVASNVYIGLEGKKAVFATRSGAGVNIKHVAISKFDGKQEVLVNRAALANTIDQISQGETVEVSVRDSDIHLVVKGENIKRHIRLATSAHDVKTFQFDLILNNTRGGVSKSIAVVKVNKRDLISTMKSADTIATLNSKNDPRDINIAVNRDGIVISVEDRAGFEDTVDIKSLVGEPASLAFRWSQFVSLFDAYPGDEEEIIIALIPKDGKLIRAIALINDDNFAPGDDASDLTYIAMAAASSQS